MQKQEQKFSKIKINPEYLDLVPRLSVKDRERLAESIKKDGLFTPITVNDDGIILDGHTRYEICKEFKIKIRYHVKSFDNQDDEMRFVIMTNLARRQLSKFQKAELAWPLFELEKKRAKERADWRSNKSLCITDKFGRIVKAKKPIKEGQSAALFGKKIGVGKTLINQMEYLKQYASDQVLEKLRSGQMSTVMAFDLVRGLRLIPDGKKPDKPIKFCPTCNTETTSPMRRKCHIHKYFCCKHCRWGI